MKSEVVLEVDFKVGHRISPKFQSQAFFPTNKDMKEITCGFVDVAESPMIHLIFPNYSRPHNTQCGDLSLSSVVVLHK